MPWPDSLITIRCVKDTMSTTDNEHLLHSVIKKALEIIVDYFLEPIFIPQSYQIYICKGNIFSLDLRGFDFHLKTFS